jgi:hypothetical protein
LLVRVFRSPIFSSSSFFAFLISFPFIKTTSGISIFYLVLPKLLGDTSSLIIFLLSSFCRRPNFYCELDLLLSLSLSLSLYSITLECMDCNRDWVSPGALIILLLAVLFCFLCKVIWGGLRLLGKSPAPVPLIWKTWRFCMAATEGFGETATSTSFSSSTVSLQCCFL